MIYGHVSAMLHEAVACLNCRPGGIYVDGTIGGAGHARAICRLIMPGGKLIGIDQDSDAIANAQTLLEPFAPDVHLYHGNFIQLPEFLYELQIDAIDGVLLDLGLSQHQLESSGRGFSFQKDEPLDMRMDIRSPKKAADLVNDLAEEELIRIFKDYGEERWSKRIAGAIVAAPARSASSLSLRACAGPVANFTAIGRSGPIGSSPAGRGAAEDPSGHPHLHGLADHRE